MNDTRSGNPSDISLLQAWQASAVKLRDSCARFLGVEEDRTCGTRIREYGYDTRGQEQYVCEVVRGRAGLSVYCCIIIRFILCASLVRCSLAEDVVVTLSRESKRREKHT